MTGLGRFVEPGTSRSKVLRVLYLEDSPLDAELVQANLAKGGITCEVVRVQTRVDFVAALEEGGFDLIFADYSIPSYDGLSALEAAREIRPEVPLILISGTVDEDLAIETLKSGATDYVLKHRLERLVPAVRRAMNEAEERRERERTEEALRRSEEKYRMLVEQIPAATYTQEIVEPGSSRTSPTLYASPQIESQTGYPPQSFVEDPELWIRILHPQDRERVLAEDRRTDETGEPFRMEYRQITRDGRTVWIRDEAVLVRDEEGRPRFWQGVMYDITERKATEEELARLASYPTLNPNPILETNSSGRTTYLNPAAQRLFPDLPVRGPQHPVLSDLRSIERQIRKSGGQPAVRETEVDKKIYQQTIWPVQGSDLLRIYAVDVTERRQAVDALRESEEWFRATFEQAAVGIAHNALDGSWLRVNQRLCDILGYNREELQRRTFQGVTHPDDLDTDLDQSRRLLAGEIPTFSMEKRYIKKDGSMVWGNLTVSLVRELSGEPKYFIAVVEDITERKQVEEELKQSEERFRQLFEQSVDALFVHDENGSFIDCNSQACRLLGYTRQELLSLSVKDISCNMLTEEERALKENEGGTLWQRALAGTPGTFALSHEEENRRKDGTTFPAEVRVGSVDYGGRRMILAATRDITERKRVEEELKQSEERFRLLAERTNDLICLHEPDGRCLYVSPSCRRLLGYDPQELLGKDLYHLMHPADAERIHLGAKTKALEGEGAGPVTYRIRKKSGEYVWFETLTEEILDEAGEVVRLQTSSRDVSERKHAEETLRQSEQLFRAIFEQAAVGTVQVGLDGGWIRFNDKVCEILGYTREELPTVDFRDILMPEVLERDLARGARMLAGELRDYSEEKLIRRKDGSWAWIYLTVSLIYSSSGPEHYVAVIEDITERRHTEDALTRSEILYRTVVEQAAENIFVVDLESHRILEANAALQHSLGYTAEELTDMTLYDIVAHDKESIDENTRRVVAQGHLFIGERCYRRKDGTLVDVEVSVSTVPYEGRDAMAVVAHNITERKRAEENLRNSLSVLLALREAGQVLGSTLSSEEIVSRLLEIMRGVSHLTAVVLSVEDEGELRIWRSAGLERLRRRARFEQEAEAARRATLEDEEHRTFRLRGSGPEDDTLIGLCLPLRIKDRVVGVLEAYGEESLAETDPLEILSSLSSQAASALENAWLYEELGERERALQDLVGKLLGAQEEERRRVAYEVHDGLAQVAVAAHQNLQAFARRYPPSTQRGQNELKQIVEQVRATVSDARRIIANLRPTVLDDLGLAAAISQEVEHLREIGYQVDYEETLGDQRLPDRVEIALFRIAQEALTNVRKHAQTRRVRIRLERSGDEAHLEVRDYGRGFDPIRASAGSGPGERVGLAGMRERVGMLGGELEILCPPDAGTSVVVSIPVT